MKTFERYPLVKDLINYYSEKLHQPNVKCWIESGNLDAQKAEQLGYFIWQMVDSMREDNEAGVMVLGRVDNSDMLADLHYEISCFMSDNGFSVLWERICDEA